MAKYDQPVFQGHHVIEQDAYARSKLLQDLAREGLYDLHGDRNLLNLPADKQLALQLEVTPHNGGPLGQYSEGLTDALVDLEKVQMVKPHSQATDLQRSEWLSASTV